MSLIDMDERLLDIFERADLVYSPLVDFKEYPEAVDVCLVEGAVSSEEDLHKIEMVRERTKTIVAFGDCAVTSNVPGMRNPIGVQPLLDRAYLENIAVNPQIPSRMVPKLLPVARPVHLVIPVDIFLPGCPPSADLIYNLLDDLLAGRVPDATGQQVIEQVVDEVGRGRAAGQEDVDRDHEVDWPRHRQEFRDHPRRDLRVDGDVLQVRAIQQRLNADGVAHARDVGCHGAVPEGDDRLGSFTDHLDLVEVFFAGDRAFDQADVDRLGIFLEVDERAVDEIGPFEDVEQALVHVNQRHVACLLYTS